MKDNFFSFITGRMRINRDGSRARKRAVNNMFWTANIYFAALRVLDTFVLQELLEYGVCRAVISNESRFESVSFPPAI